MKALKFLVEEARMKQVEDVSKASKKERPRKFIEPLIENFRRTQKGEKLVQQELWSLLNFQAKNFPLKPMLSEDKKVIRYTEQKENREVPVDEVMSKIHMFFSVWFRDERNKQAYGVKVQGWLVEETRLCSDHFEYLCFFTISNFDPWKSHFLIGYLFIFTQLS